MVTLPSINDILAGESTAPAFRPPPPSLGLKSNPPLSKSVPMTQHDQLLLDRFLPYRGPTLPPLSSVSSAKDESPPGFRALEQLACPPLTDSSASSPCSTETDDATTADVDGNLVHLQALVDLSDSTVAVAVDLVQKVLQDSAIKPAYDQGWFKPTSPTNKFNKRIEDRIAGKPLDEVVDGFFRRDESREIYGERVTKPRKLVKKDSPGESRGTEELDPELVAKQKKRQEADEAHRMAENNRRDRHRESQMESHRRCPDLAAECGAEHARAEKKSRIQSGKGPGKDDQLWAAIYAHEMAGRVMQAVNDQRIQAKTALQLVLPILIRLQELLKSAQRGLSHYGSARESFLPQTGYVGRKRTRDDMERESRARGGVSGERT